MLFILRYFSLSSLNEMFKLSKSVIALKTVLNYAFNYHLFPHLLKCLFLTRNDL